MQTLSSIPAPELPSLIRAFQSLPALPRQRPRSFMPAGLSWPTSWTSHLSGHHLLPLTLHRAPSPRWPCLGRLPARTSPHPPVPLLILQRSHPWASPESALYQSSAGSSSSVWESTFLGAGLISAERFETFNRSMELPPWTFSAPLIPAPLCEGLCASREGPGYSLPLPVCGPQANSDLSGAAQRGGGPPGTDIWMMWQDIHYAY